MVDFATARLNMVESQLRTNRVSNRALLEAFEKTPRERFVPESLRGIAYVDEDIQIAPDRYLMEPMVLARLLQALDIEEGDAVLDIGAATGYSSAVISRLAAAVIALEHDHELYHEAGENLADLGIDNVVFVEGALNLGYPAQAPYDVIVFQGAVPEVPPGILDQLADGGRLCAVVDDGAGLGRATLMIKSAGVVSGRVLFDANIQPLAGFEKKQGFVF